MNLKEKNRNNFTEDIMNLAYDINDLIFLGENNPFAKNAILY